MSFSDLHCSLRSFTSSTQQFVSTRALWSTLTHLIRCRHHCSFSPTLYCTLLDTLLRLHSFVSETTYFVSYPLLFSPLCIPRLFELCTCTLFSLLNIASLKPLFHHRHCVVPIHVSFVSSPIFFKALTLCHVSSRAHIGHLLTSIHVYCTRLIRRIIN